MTPSRNGSNGDDGDERTARLRRLREETRDAIDRTDLAADGDERGDGHHHPAEVATDADARERQLAEQMKLREREERLAAAEKAIEEGTYGVCVDCGGEIPEGRLKVVPDAVRCVPCQTEAKRLGRV